MIKISYQIRSDALLQSKFTLIKFTTLIKKITST